MKKGISDELLSKFQSLLQEIGKIGSAIVCFSGGVDSTVLLKACQIALKDKILAVTSFSPTFSRYEIEEAKKIAEVLSVRHILLETDELSDPDYVKNGKRRCYICRKGFFLKVKTLANSLGIYHILYGANFDDLSDYRPGMRAAKEEGISAPLLDFRFRKKDVRDIAFFLGLPNWDKPSSPCLSTRIPFGSKITEKKLRQVESAEDFLREKGLRSFRVRHHGNLARIEIGSSEFEKIIDAGLREEIILYIKKLGFKYVSLDLESLKRE